MKTKTKKKTTTKKNNNKDKDNKKDKDKEKHEDKHIAYKIKVMGRDTCGTLTTNVV